MIEQCEGACWKCRVRRVPMDIYDGMVAVWSKINYWVRF